MFSLGGRNPATLVRALLQPRHYRALRNSFSTYVRPHDGLLRYLTRSGTYPVDFPLLTPLGVMRPRLYSHHDMLTVNEIFCREDYNLYPVQSAGPEPQTRQVIVDLGSNIGLSALYFLSRNKQTFCYLYEPLPQNLERLRHNLAGFSGRYSLEPVAVSLSDGEADFGYEASGRYGGIGLAHASRLNVKSLALNGILEQILAREGRIDLLKIDIESLEKELIAAIPEYMLRSIKAICVEQYYASNPLPDYFSFEQYGPIARLRSLPAP